MLGQSHREADPEGAANKAVNCTPQLGGKAYPKGSHTCLLMFDGLGECLASSPEGLQADLRKGIQRVLSVLKKMNREHNMFLSESSTSQLPASPATQPSFSGPSCFPCPGSLAHLLKLLASQPQSRATGDTAPDWRSRGWFWNPPFLTS